MKTELYYKSFEFQANRFEEFQNGKCISSGNCKTLITATVITQDVIAFVLNDLPKIKINYKFGLPILGELNGDILEDRIQYGRLPDSLSWNDSNQPIVCNIFNNATCIRFAMLSPLRIIEFFGEFKTIGNSNLNEMILIGENLLKEYRDYGSRINVHNIIDMCTFGKIQTQFETRANNFIKSFQNIETQDFFGNDINEYQKLRELISTIRYEIF